MAFDIIVFTQDELENALNTGNISIGLCDNIFALPLIGGICYTAIGNVSAAINTTQSEFDNLNITCCGFSPEFSQKAPVNPIPPVRQSSAASASSYITSYFLSSYFMTSYRYIYEYEYETGGSFAASYTTSYAASFRTSLSSSLSSFVTTFRQEEEKCVLVNGYGINLI